MKSSFLLLFLTASSLALNAQFSLPAPDHVIIIMLENKGYSNIIGSSNAPYLNTLVNDPKCAVFSNSFGVTHPSQPNYISLFSGNNQGVVNDNAPTGTPYSTCNLGHSLLSNGLTFAGYSEDLPSVGSLVNTSGNYAQKHSPWTFWQGTGTNQLPATVNQPYTTFQSITNYSVLPTVSFLIPNLANDMHNPIYSASTAITNGDNWLSTNIPSLVSWVKTHNSLLIIQYDEDEGLVVGGVVIGGNNNNIPTMLIGSMVHGGTYTNHINHFSILRTIEDMYALPQCDSSAFYQPITTCWDITGVNDITKQSASIKLYPNPVNEQLNLQINASTNTKAFFTVSDISGRVLSKNEEALNSGINTKSIPTQLLHSGIYLLSIKGDQINYTSKFIVE